MMKKAFLSTLLALVVAFVPSCVQRPYAYAAESYEMGSVNEIVYGTVIQAAKIRVGAPEASKGLGMMVGAGTGFGAGQLLGSGTGRVASAMGFTLLGALVGQNVGAAVGQSDGQELLIKADKTGRIFCIRQPIYVEIGEIQAGTHGYLAIGPRRSVFRPDGY